MAPTAAAWVYTLPGHHKESAGSSESDVYVVIHSDMSLSGSSLGGNMLIFQASVSGSGQRFFCLANASMALALSAHTPWVQLVSHVSACWLTGLRFRHT